ncbi:hypothetical protein E5Q_04045 [Mixia osmundae IAM 14324]|uniref:glutathione peroxidase n=1 Tax=Mixia osmundae (strain CBS 9802 / IAM 14324 / JCM 22182 / KY 12970) TaxID=764103 RepID=G7E3F7_MIXOS|nr:hypothetical protein E5Q_04045 [Mixia osmundae IAM 14324]
MKVDTGAGWASNIYIAWSSTSISALPDRSLFFRLSAWKSKDASCRVRIASLDFMLRLITSRTQVLRPRSFIRTYARMASPQSIVDDAIASHHVVVFSKSWCPFCKRAKGTLSSLDVKEEQKPYIIELDEHDKGSEIQDYLAEKSGQRSVPNIWIGQKHIGGSDDLETLKEQDKLTAMFS